MALSCSHTCQSLKSLWGRRHKKETGCQVVSEQSLQPHHHPPQAWSYSHPHSGEHCKPGGPEQLPAESVENPRILRNTVRTCAWSQFLQLLFHNQKVLCGVSLKNKINISYFLVPLLPNMQVSLECVSSDPTSVNPVQKFWIKLGRHFLFTMKKQQPKERAGEEAEECLRAQDE